MGTSIPYGESMGAKDKSMGYGRAAQRLSWHR